MSQVVKVVKAYVVGKPPSTIVVIPKEFKVKAGKKFYAKIDEQGRIIYEPLEKEGEMT